MGKDGAGGGRGDWLGSVEFCSYGMRVGVDGEGFFFSDREVGTSDGG